MNGQTAREMRELAAGIRGEAEALQDGLFTLYAMCTALEGLAEGRRRPHNEATEQTEATEKALG